MAGRGDTLRLLKGGLGWGILKGLVEIHRELEALRVALKSSAMNQSNAGESGDNQSRSLCPSITNDGALLY